MLVTISTTMEPATDLGFLLHKHPDRVQSFPVAAGTAHVFYPEATGQRCTAALLVEVDPVGLVRGSQGHAAEAFTLGQYVNDRPYAASSMVAVALSRVFKTAMAGQCNARPELAARSLPLELYVPALPCRGGADLARRVFGPLGWEVEANPVKLDPSFPEWGDSEYVELGLNGSMRLADALNHLYVLLPVLDDAKHYWVSTDEVDKLVRAGHGWLGEHPELELITTRYLAHQAGMRRTALARLAEVDDAPAEAIDNATDGPQVASLAELRADAVLAVLREVGARSVADLGCGDGRLLVRLLGEPGVDRVLATDVSARALEMAVRRLERMADRQRERAEIFQSSLVYTDERLTGLDAAILMEVVEHIDPPRLAAMARAVFGHAAPGTVVMTTPNAEYNVRYPALGGGFRHRDHRFEWDRRQFREWATDVAGQYGYDVRFGAVGDQDADFGAPSQLAIFGKENRHTAPAGSGR